MEGDEDWGKIITDTLADEDNLCDDFVLAEVAGHVVGVMVKPGHQGLYTIFTADRLQHMHGAIHQIEAGKR